MDLRSVLYPRTWTFNPQASMAFSPYRDWPQEKLIFHPEQYKPPPVPHDNPKYPDQERKYPQYKYPYEIELDEKANVNYQLNKQKIEQDEKNNLAKIDTFNLYKPSNRVVYMSEKLKKTIDPMIGILVDMINMEIDCENLRCDLCMQPEFQISKLYHIFNSIPATLKDVDGITVKEFKDAIKGFGIQADQQDVEMLMVKHQQVEFKRKSEELYVDYYNFNNMFMPLSRQELFDNKMRVKQNAKQDDTIGRKFSVITNYHIDHLLRLMLSQEQMYEQMRRQIQALDLDLQQMFSYINNASSDEDLSVQQLNHFFRDHGVLFQDCEVQLIAFRMTKRHSKTDISLAEFIKELTPRLVLHSNQLNIEEQLQKGKENAKKRDIEYEQYMANQTQTSAFKKKTRDNYVF